MFLMYKLSTNVVCFTSPTSPLPNDLAITIDIYEAKVKGYTLNKAELCRIIID